MADPTAVCVRCGSSFELVHDDDLPKTLRDEVPGLILCDDCIKSFKRWWYAQEKDRS